MFYSLNTEKCLWTVSPADPLTLNKAGPNTRWILTEEGNRKEPLSPSSDIIWTRAALHNKHIIWTTQILSTQHTHSSPALSSSRKRCLSVHEDLHRLILKLKEWWQHRPGPDLVQCVCLCTVSMTSPYVLITEALAKQWQDSENKIPQHQISAD